MFKVASLYRKIKKLIYIGNSGNSGFILKQKEGSVLVCIFFLLIIYGLGS